MGFTRILAQYAAGVEYKDLPESVITQAKYVIRDSLGCLLGGSTFSVAQELSQLMINLAPDGRATVAGVGRRVAAPFACYINAQLTNLLDFDDTLEGKALGHPGATIIPTALALAEERKATGKELLMAVVVGYEIYARVAMAGKPSFERSKQVRGLASWQVLGAAATAARLLRLDAEAMARAFGLAVLHAPVPFIGKFYEERPLWTLKNNFGWAAMGGLLSALYAEKGYDANHEILDGPTGFWVMAGSDRCDFALLTRGLGSIYHILEVSFKPYPCCRYTHTSLDALSNIIRHTNLQPEKVQAIYIYGGSKISVFADYRPRSFIDAEFSLPYVVAMLLLREPPGYKWFDGERWHDPEILSLADRVQLVFDPEAEAELAQGFMRARVKVIFMDGQEKKAEAIYAHGHPCNPMSANELEEKFLSLAERVIGEKGAEELNNLINHMDELSDLSLLTAYLKRK